MIIPILLTIILLFVVFGVYAERKISAFIQDRRGPTRTGYKGLLQTVADLIKLVQKEDTIPSFADRFLFKNAPFLLFSVVFLLFSVIPLSENWFFSRFDSSVFFLTSFISLDVIFLALAGWASSNKFSLLGAVRTTAQMISYEAPLAFTVLTVVVLTGSQDIWQTVMQQSSNETVAFLSWNFFKYPVLIPVSLIFFLTTLAQANRAPFDVPEAESEIIAGFMTEYSGFRWAVFMLSEYALMLLSAYWTVFLFFGGWQPFFALPMEINEGSLAANAEDFLYLHIKVLIIVFLQMWFRWTFPRMRTDALMSFAWKKLLPASLILFLTACFLKL
jgi:NADH-quinone oxidoreductase subunit H